MKREDLVRLNALRAERRAAVYVADLDQGGGRLITEGEEVEDNLAASVKTAFLTGKSAQVEIDGKRLFLNVQVPPPRIVAIGAVHITQALAPMAAIAGFDLSVIDPRTAFATPERFEGVDLVADWPEDVLEERALDAYTALIAVTHDPKIDDYPIAAGLKAGCFYVGALGSRKTHGKRVDRLMELGLTETQIARIDAPIGLDIGAISPAEIAVSILGAVIQAFRRRAIR
ncbi:xanthine dehydrogenase accessory factor [Rhizobium sp. SG_E_25_P2]|uniref:XdhC family protein n=1 Tax=Rhizobium sp. SG_E_25_P2 TaxID=2879942 RepID=UPI002475806F|nr:XdhC family protein [Rhizobium sp. SG_E_25_P2]MDH6268977.1 xanthine dehydrogenase accessory factor [Rhizobium sp. SG_E_25_P2]